MLRENRQRSLRPKYEIRKGPTQQCRNRHDKRHRAAHAERRADFLRDAKEWTNPDEILQHEIIDECRAENEQKKIDECVHDAA